MRFSADLPELTAEEKQAEEKLNKLKGELSDDKYNISIHNFFETRPKLLKSKLYEMLNEMPKGALHHLHTTASPSGDFYMKLTYNDSVYYNEREQLFKVAPKGLHEDGFLRCTDMRKWSKNPDEFDLKIKNLIEMQEHECMSNESHDIWKHFQHRFTLINDIGKYQEFFKKIIHEVLSKCAKQNIFVVELRHMFGMLFDEERKPVPVEEELRIIQEIVDHIKQDVPHFEMKLITCGLKIVGRPHIQK